MISPEEVQARFGSEIDHPELIPLAVQVFEVANKKAGKDNYTIELTTIIMLVSLIYQIGKIIWGWYNEDEERAIRGSRRFSMWQRFIIWTVVVRRFSWRERKYLYNGVTGMAKRFTDNERRVWFGVYK